MGRYSSDITYAPTANQSQSTDTSAPGSSSVPQQSQMLLPPGHPGVFNSASAWPTKFNKPVVGLDLNGVIVDDVRPLNHPSKLSYIAGSLEAIRIIRTKGHKLTILSDQPDIMNGTLTTQMFDEVITSLMMHFGQAGIMTIDGLYYNTSSMKQDEYAKPNIGMAKRAEQEQLSINFKKGWYVGDSIEDLKMAEKMGSRPVLVLSGQGRSTLKRLDSHSLKSLKKKTLVFENLLEFSRTL